MQFIIIMLFLFVVFFFMDKKKKERKARFRENMLDYFTKEEKASWEKTGEIPQRIKHALDDPDYWD